MTTAVPGLIKIGKTGSDNFTQRMYNLEHNGYRNVTYLKRAFAIEVDDYNKKEEMLHKIFEKSRVGDTELFALDIHIAIQLLSSFEGKLIYPIMDTKQDIFMEATDIEDGRVIPNGVYYMKKGKKADNRTLNATAHVENGIWTLKQGSVLATTENKGVSQKAKELRISMPIDGNGVLLEDVELGECSPSFAATIVANQSENGWDDWVNTQNEKLNIFRPNIVSAE